MEALSPHTKCKNDKVKKYINNLECIQVYIYIGIEYIQS